MRLFRILPTVFISAIVLAIGLKASGEPTVAPTQSPPATSSEEQRASLAAIQGGDLAQARERIMAAVKADPNCASCLYNWGLVEFRDGKSGLALGIWRKAARIAPSYDLPKRGIDWVNTKLDRRDSTSESGALEWAWSSLERINAWILTIICASVFAASLWSWIEWQAKRKARAQDEDTREDVADFDLPWTAIALGVLCLASAGLIAAKSLNDAQLRATVVVARTPALSAPDQGAAPLFDLFEGAEVIVRQSKDGWTQIERTGGAVGWLPDATLFR